MFCNNTTNTVSCFISWATAPSYPTRGFSLEGQCGRPPPRWGGGGHASTPQRCGASQTVAQSQVCEGSFVVDIERATPSHSQCGSSSSSLDWDVQQNLQFFCQETFGFLLSLYVHHVTSRCRGGGALYILSPFHLQPFLQLPFDCLPS